MAVHLRRDIRMTATNTLLDDLDAIWSGVRIPLAIIVVVLLGVIAVNTR